jgi:asparagine synthase (glutamine-hydrolysing)
MCGIVGIAQQPGRHRFASDDVRRMADQIFHRGPDDEGFHDGGRVVIGMRRLSIIDLEGGHQPIANEDQTVWVVNNGEIYNFQSLREDLLRKGHKFTTHSDTEVLVHLYEEHGEAFLEHLEGMFAAALWDSTKNRLIVARDRLGIKPVYYWPFGGGLAFSSEIKAFLPLQGFSPSVNTRSLADYLGIGYAVAPETIFEGVRKLEPGTFLRWTDEGFSTHRYWSLPTETDTSRSYDDWVEATAAELQRAVADHMIADVPVGAFLSGGIDSSAVAALMSRATNAELNTYSIGYAGSSVAEYYNELPFAKTVADQLGSNHREIAVEPNVASLLPKLIWHLEEPISDSAITTTFLVSELAAESVKVILSGVGGDELFAGYNRYLGDHYDRRYRRIPAILRQRLLPGIAGLLPSGRQNRLMDMSRYAKRFIQAGQLGWRQRYAFYLAIADDGLLAEMLGEELAGNGLARVAAAEDSGDELLRLLRIDWQTQLAENLLLLTDKMSMACSLECRVPFLDHRLVEFAAGIPAQHKLPGGRLKGLLKDSLRSVLPASVIDRRKRGFGAPVGAWFKQELAGLRAELLSDAALEDRGLIDADSVRRLCADHDNNREDYTDLILVLMNLEIWARLFLDGTSHEDVAAQLAERSMAA